MCGKSIGSGAAHKQKKGDRWAAREISTGLLGLGLERALGYFHQLGKSRLILRGYVRQHLAVNLHLGSFQALNKAAVSHVICATTGVDPHVPQRAEGALFIFTITISVLPAMIEGVLGVTVKLAATQPKALGGLEPAFAAFAGGGSVGDAHGI